MSPHVDEFPGPGWRRTSLPGMDLLRLDLEGTSGLVPAVTIRQGADAWGDVVRDDPRGEETAGIVIARDRWLGSHWFGWRLVSLVPLGGGLSAPVVRWFLWSVQTDGAVDVDRDVPQLDVSASCTLRALPLAQGLMDSLVADIPGDWQPGRPPSPPLDLQVSAAPSPPRAPWGWLPLHVVSAELRSVLERLGAGPGATDPMGYSAAVRQDLDVLEFMPPEEGELTDRGRRAAEAAADPDGISTLTTWTSGGMAEPLTVLRRGTSALVGVRAGDATGRTRFRFGLTPIEYVAETVTALVGLEAADSRAFTVDTVDMDMLRARALDPQRAMPEAVADDPLWTTAWSDPWILWRLSSHQRAEVDHPSGDRVPRADLVVLTAGSAGHFRLSRGQGEDPRVRLQPLAGTDLLTAVLDQLGGVPVA